MEKEKRANRIKTKAKHNLRKYKTIKHFCEEHVLLDWYVDATKTVKLLFLLLFFCFVSVYFEIVYYGNLAQG